MGLGKDYQKKHSQFVSFDDDGVITGVFEGMKVITKESFGQEREVMRYKIDGKTFDSQSGNLAALMDEVKIGQKIKISRAGEGMDTRYSVEVMGAQNPLNPEEKASW